MLLRLQPRRDERAAVLMLDLASAIDAGLPAERWGGQPQDGEQVLERALPRRGVAVDGAEPVVLRAGWRSGRPADSLRRLAQQRQQRADFARQILSLLRYPTMLLLVAFVVSFVAAKLGAMWLPWTIGAAIAAMAFVVFALRRQLRSGNPALLRVPMLGPLLRDLGAIPYLDVLHACYASGIPLLQAHREAVSACHVPAVATRLALCDALVQQGKPVAESMEQTLALDEETRSLLATGETTGTLEDALRRASTRRRDEAQRRAIALSKGISSAVYAIGLLAAVATIVSFYAGYAAQLRALR